MTTQTTQYDLDMMKAMASLFRKKAAVMAALGGGMVKKGKNDHFDYKFMTASDIKQTVSRLFAEHGLSLQMSGVSTQDVVTQVEVKDYQNKTTRIKDVPILRVQFSISLCDVDTGAVQESFWFGEAGATDDKAASKAATSALKYFLISNLLIADRDEDKRDTDADQPRKKRPQEQAPVSADIPPSSPAKAAPPVVTLSSSDTDKWLAFLDWAKKKFSFAESTVNSAVFKFGNGQGIYSGPRDLMMAHVLAHASGYDPTRVTENAILYKINEQIESLAIELKRDEIPF